MATHKPHINVGIIDSDASYKNNAEKLLTKREISVLKTAHDAIVTNTEFLANHRKPRLERIDVVRKLGAHSMGRYHLGYVDDGDINNKKTDFWCAVLNNHQTETTIDYKRGRVWLPLASIRKYIKSSKTLLADIKKQHAEKDPSTPNLDKVFSIATVYQPLKAMVIADQRKQATAIDRVADQSHRSVSRLPGAIAMVETPIVQSQPAPVHHSTPTVSPVSSLLTPAESTPRLVAKPVVYVQPSQPEPLEAEPAPRTVVPQTQVPQAVAPRTVAPQAVAPQAVAPRTVAPQAVAPRTVAPVQEKNASSNTPSRFAATGIAASFLLSHPLVGERLERFFRKLPDIQGSELFRKRSNLLLKMLGTTASLSYASDVLKSNTEYPLTGSNTISIQEALQTGGIQKDRHGFAVRQDGSYVANDQGQPMKAKALGLEDAPAYKPGFQKEWVNRLTTLGGLADLSSKATLIGSTAYGVHLALKGSRNLPAKARFLVDYLRNPVKDFLGKKKDLYSWILRNPKQRRVVMGKAGKLLGSLAAGVGLLSYLNSEETQKSSSTRTLAPQAIAPRTVVPQTQVPQAIAPRTSVPQAVLSTTQETPFTADLAVDQNEAPRTQVPQAIAPRTQVPQAIAPRTQVPQAVAPQTVMASLKTQAGEVLDQLKEDTVEVGNEYQEGMGRHLALVSLASRKIKNLDTGDEPEKQPTLLKVLKGEATPKEWGANVLRKTKQFAMDIAVPTYEIGGGVIAHPVATATKFAEGDKETIEGVQTLFDIGEWATALPLALLAEKEQTKQEHGQKYNKVLRWAPTALSGVGAGLQVYSVLKDKDKSDREKAEGVTEALVQRGLEAVAENKSLTIRMRHKITQAINKAHFENPYLEAIKQLAAQGIGWASEFTADSTIWNLGGSLGKDILGKPIGSLFSDQKPGDKSPQVKAHQAIAPRTVVPQTSVPQAVALQTLVPQTSVPQAVALQTPVLHALAFDLANQKATDDVASASLDVVVPDQQENLDRFLLTHSPAVRGLVEPSGLATPDQATPVVTEHAITGHKVHGEHHEETPGQLSEKVQVIEHVSSEIADPLILSLTNLGRRGRGESRGGNHGGQASKFIAKAAPIIETGIALNNMVGLANNPELSQRDKIEKIGGELGGTVTSIGATLATAKKVHHFGHLFAEKLVERPGVLSTLIQRTPWGKKIAALTGTIALGASIGKVTGDLGEWAGEEAGKALADVQGETEEKSEAFYNALNLKQGWSLDQQDQAQPTKVQQVTPTPESLNLSGNDPNEENSYMFAFSPTPTAQETLEEQAKKAALLAEREAADTAGKKVLANVKLASHSMSKLPILPLVNLYQGAVGAKNVYDITQNEELNPHEKTVQASKETGSVVGSLLGGLASMGPSVAAGASVGTMVGGPIGTVLGFLTGTLIDMAGGMIGQTLGSWIGEKSGEVIADGLDLNNDPRKRSVQQKQESDITDNSLYQSTVSRIKPLLLADSIRRELTGKGLSQQNKPANTPLLDQVFDQVIQTFSPEDQAFLQQTDQAESEDFTRNKKQKTVNSLRESVVEAYLQNPPQHVTHTVKTEQSLEEPVQARPSPVVQVPTQETYGYIDQPSITQSYRSTEPVDRSPWQPHDTVIDLNKPTPPVPQQPSKQYKSSIKATLNEVPVVLNDMGLVLLNTGFV